MFVRMSLSAGERLDCGDDTHKGREGVDTVEHGHSELAFKCNGGSGSDSEVGRPDGPNFRSARLHLVGSCKGNEREDNNNSEGISYR